MTGADLVPSGKVMTTLAPGSPVPVMALSCAVTGAIKGALGAVVWKDLAAEWQSRGPKALKALDDLEFAKLAAGKAPTLIEADIDVRVSAWLDVVRRAGDEGPS